MIKLQKRDEMCKENGAIVLLIRAVVILALAGGLGYRTAAQTSTLPEKQTSPRPIGEATQQGPKYIEGGFDLPNGWRITPAGKAIATTGDLVLNTILSPDGKVVVGSHSGYLPHGIDVI